jgi:predicted dehydrogenase
LSDFVRIGVVGCGSIAIRGILPHLSQPDLADRVRVAAVCDPAPGRAEAAAREFGVPRFFESFEELLEKGDVDAVSIASPIGLHYEQGMMALEAGKHIHFNKTMTTTVAEADKVIDAAAARRLHVVASPGEMLRPHNQRIRELIAEGALGTLVWASGGAAFGRYHENERVRGGDGPLTNVDPSWYFRSPGGGPLYDMTVYPLHTLTGILGPAKAVTALSGVRIREREFGGRTIPTDADDNSFMLLDFGGALVAVVYGAAAGNLNDGHRPSFFGAQGSIIGLRMNGEPFDYASRDAAEAHPKGVQAVLPHTLGTVHADIEEQHVFEDVMQLVDWVRDGTPSVATAEHARHVIDIIESAYRSARTGQLQALSTAF